MLSELVCVCVCGVCGFITFLFENLCVGTIKFLSTEKEEGSYEMALILLCVCLCKRTKR